MSMVPPCPGLYGSQHPVGIPGIGLGELLSFREKHRKYIEGLHSGLRSVR